MTRSPERSTILHVLMLAAIPVRSGTGAPSIDQVRKGMLGNGGMGRDVILVHGNSLSSGIWQEQLASPSLAHRRLHAIDLAGHGESPPFAASRPYTLSAFAAEVAEFVRGMESPVLVGHSLGGHICMRVPALAPNVRGLLITGAPPLSSAADMSRAFLPTPALANAFRPDLTEEDARVSAEVYTWPGSPWIGPMARMILSADPRVRSDIGAEILSGTMADEHALLKDSGIPVCLVHGQDEATISLDYLNEISGMFWQEGVHVLKACGHSPQIQKPMVFNALLRQFIATL